MKKDGETCWVATSSPSCLAVSSTDTAPALLALGAEVTLVSAEGTRRLALSDLYRNDGIHYLTQAAERDPDRRSTCRRSRAGAAPTGSCGGEARSTFRCCRWPPRSRSRPMERSKRGASSSAPSPRGRSKSPAAAGAAHRQAARRRGDRGSGRGRGSTRQADGQHRLLAGLAQACDAGFRRLRAAGAARRRHARGAPENRAAAVLKRRRRLRKSTRKRPPLKAARSAFSPGSPGRSVGLP